MIKDIIKDPVFLSQKSSAATKADQQVMTNLMDTIQAHHEHCVGMAANMIGVNKQIIVIWCDDHFLLMNNPKLIKTSKTMRECEEGCLCHTGVKKVKRFDSIKISYEDENFKKRIKTFSGFTAEIIQHEMDHCEGILI